MTVGTLAVGAHLIVARYGGDTTHTLSQAPPPGETVCVALVSGRKPATVGDTVVLTV